MDTSNCVSKIKNEKAKLSSLKWKNVNIINTPQPLKGAKGHLKRIGNGLMPKVRNSPILNLEEHLAQQSNHHLKSMKHFGKKKQSIKDQIANFKKGPEDSLNLRVDAQFENTELAEGLTNMINPSHELKKDRRNKGNMNIQCTTGHSYTYSHGDISGSATCRQNQKLPELYVANKNHKSSELLEGSKVRKNTKKIKKSKRRVASQEISNPHNQSTRYDNPSGIDNNTIDLSQLNIELEVHVQYLKEVVRSIAHENKKKDFRIKTLLAENTELKKLIKDKDQLIENLSKTKEENINIIEKEPVYEPSKDIIADDDLQYFISTTLERISSKESYDSYCAEESKLDSEARIHNYLMQGMKYMLKVDT